jgi:hypothetical protein
MSNPQAYIKVQGNRLNVENNNTVYLEKDTEFGIELFNPTQGRIGALISINGKPFSDKFILRPGEKATIERYIEEARKFKFDTYMVDGASADVKKAIEDNGGVTVSFYREKERYQGLTRGISKGFPSSGRLYNQTIGGYSGQSLSGDLNYNFTSSINAEANFSTTDWMEQPLYSQELSRGIIDMNFAKPEPAPKPIETGRVEKGSHSSQTFHTVDVDLEYSYFHRVHIKLLPVSQRPQEEAPLYCTGCSRRFRAKENFCPKCGTSKTCE